MSFLSHVIGEAWFVLGDRSKAERGCVYCIQILKGWEGISGEDRAIRAIDTMGTTSDVNWS